VAWFACNHFILIWSFLYPSGYFLTNMMEESFWVFLETIRRRKSRDLMVLSGILLRHGTYTTKDQAHAFEQPDQ
jgi:hypothetical protein